jgi:hypothetical protein
MLRLRLDSQGETADLKPWYDRLDRALTTNADGSLKVRCSFRLEF